ncbi:MAG: aromatic ring-hydroxylating dioxygenase subunit alpha [Leptolyngbyaceae cyanobacterium SU_3_3]|nr:aromatic ring-hydroxylating dioxygenase subunit alpha [Leptolyngbyaceae cyanobacterium SU_3_3]NJR52080.1 aromatic ring-hydroxylating dioxygenase subunit alpha [Leptolyngbyaceae cyanobacterium CSU_1_3]
MVESIAVTQIQAGQIPIEGRVDPVLYNDWYAIARSSDVPAGTVRSAQLFGVNLVLWRGENTAVLAWHDRCPHRSVRLSGGKVEDNCLVCPYHALAFNAEGRCVKVPAHPDYVPPKQACAQTFLVSERYGVIFVSLGNPIADVVPFPEWDDPDYRTYLSGGHRFRCSGLRAIENFLDVSHLPFVHGGILGESDRPTIADYEVMPIETGIYMKNIQIWQPDPDGTGQGGIATYDYWTLRPLVAALRKQKSDGQTMILWYVVTPISEEECVGWMWGALNYAHHIPKSDLVAFQDRVMLQDVENLESHNPKRLPLDTQIEFHLPSDRASLAYRKWLKKLGVTYGTVCSR